mmetsp:Transcript_67027/g.187406  ORF Transcript_67027/g.187406 Transcript_67027/m.187406 type:complete len:831 (+) Transcript_67027:144-2636(+)
METVRALMSGIKEPQHYDKVYKDECVFTFDTPFSPQGLFVNLKTWYGFGADVVDLDVKRNGGAGGLYLQQRFHRKEKEQPKGEGGAEAPKTVGMLLEDKWEVVKEYALLAVSPSGAKETLPYPSEDLPMLVSTVCEAVIAHQGARSMEETTRYEADQDIKESKYFKDLVQLPATKKISPNPKDWRCEISGDTQNLWLNLSDGFIGGGRKFFDGSGGSNGALDHFNAEKEKGNFYPLVVKLGTITAQGADVFSYAPDEDDLVKDPLLAQHLQHWGIDSMRMEKTDKSMAEMEADFNLSYDFSRICESGEELVRLRGPGLVGLKNLGNSCYMNSTVQLLLALPEAKRRYLDADWQIRMKAPSDAATDLVAQVAKLTNGLNTDRYAPPWKEGDDEDDPRCLVSPGMFRVLIGKNHPEFSSGRQQDAGEFLQHFLEQLSRAERTALGSRLEEGSPFASLFEFSVEERLEEAGGAKRVKYSRQRSTMLGVPVKLDDAENLEDVMAYRSAHGEKDAKKPKTEGDAPEEPKPIIQLSAGLARLAAPEDGIPFRGVTVSKTSRLATMPKYMLVQVQRYYLDEKWIPSKLDCKVPMPEKLSLEHLRGRGKQEGEAEFKEDADAAASPASAVAAQEAPQADEMIVVQLLSLGIGENAARRAALAVQNASAEAATGWFFEHSEDPDINNPPAAPGGGGGATGGDDDADPSAVAMLSDMGFGAAHVKAALKACGNNAERAADWLFSHVDDLDGAVAALSAGGGGGGGGGAAGGAEASFDDGRGEYSLVGFVSHIGRHTGCGHYVCHMKRDDGWVILNDQKVAKSESPPLELGYLYLYRRDDV